MRSLRCAVLVALALTSVGNIQAQDNDELLSGRWVGLRQPPWTPRALWLEFTDDSMLVVNDKFEVNYYLTPDSLVTYGDTVFRVSYRMAAGYLVVETVEGDVITMSEQTPLARPLVGGRRWLSNLGTDQEQVELRFYQNGTAQWRLLPDGDWNIGEWDRQSRFLTFKWPPTDTTSADTTVWTGIYDAFGNAILFDSTTAGSSTSIFVRRYR